MSMLGNSGEDRPIFTGSEYSNDDKSGTDFTQRFEGTYAECKDKASSLKFSGATRIRIDSKGDGLYQLTAGWPYDYDEGPQADEIIDTMELECNVAMEAWQASTIFIYSRMSTSAKARLAIQIVDDLAKLWSSGKNLTGNKDETTTERKTEIESRLSTALAAASITSTDATYATNLFKRVAYEGLTGWLDYNPVFRRTLTASDPSQVTVSNTGAGQIWTRAEVIAFEGIPSDGWFSLPTGLNGTLWHKDFPKLYSAWGQKTQIVYTYTGIYKASGLFYTAYSGASLEDLS